MDASVACDRHDKLRNKGNTRRSFQFRIGELPLVYHGYIFFKPTRLQNAPNAALVTLAAAARVLNTPQYNPRAP